VDWQGPRPLRMGIPSLDVRIRYMRPRMGDRERPKPLFSRHDFVTIASLNLSPSIVIVPADSPGRRWLT